MSKKCFISSFSDNQNCFTLWF